MLRRSRMASLEPSAAPAARPYRLLAVAAALLAVVQTLAAAWNQDWTYDEGFHLQWSRRLWEQGLTERLSQTRFDSKTPILLPNVAAEKAARAVGLTHPRSLRFAARLPGVLWLAALLLLAHALARRWFGPTAASLATTALALDPNLVAHASLATADAAFAAATLAALAAVFGFARRPAPARGLVLGLALGLAFLAKFTAALLVPAALLGLLAARARLRPPRDGRSAVLGLALAVVVAVVFLDVAYLFKGLGVPLGAVPWRSPIFQRIAGAVPGLALPVPIDFLSGLDLTMGYESSQDWNVYLLGRLHPRGVSYYFAVLWLLKTPLLLVLAQAVGLFAGWRAGLLRVPSARYLAVALVGLLAYFSLLFKVQLGYRYVLMCVPLSWLLAAAGLAPFASRPRTVGVALLVAGVSLVETALYFGNPLSFTNLAVQPKRLAYRLVADSNIDWGQNRERVHGWLTERRMTYTHLDPLHILPGHNTVDLNTVAGVFDPEPYRWVREHLRPRGHLGHTYLLYDVDEATYREFLESARRRAPDALGEALCPADRPYLHEPIGAKVPFVLAENPPPGRKWVACLKAPRGMELSLWVTAGGLGVGRFTSLTTCETQPVMAGQEAWWKLDPGTHAFCVVTEPNRRAWLPYRMDARWFLGGRQVLIDVRPLAPASTPPLPEATTPRSSSPPRPPGG